MPLARQSQFMFRTRSNHSKTRSRLTSATHRGAPISVAPFFGS